MTTPAPLENVNAVIDQMFPRSINDLIDRDCDVIDFASVRSVPEAQRILNDAAECGRCEVLYQDYDYAIIRWIDRPLIEVANFDEIVPAAAPLVEVCHE